MDWIETDWLELGWVMQMTASGTLAIVFAYSVLHKLKSLARFQAALAAYELIPPALVSIAARLVILLEIAAIVALLVPIGPGGWIAFALLSVYTAALSVNLLRGNTAIDCGCGDTPTPISGWLLLRNGALLLLVLLHQPVDGGASAAGWLLVIALVSVLSLFYLIAEQLLSNQHPPGTPLSNISDA